MSLSDMLGDDVNLHLICDPEAVIINGIMAGAHALMARGAGGFVWRLLSAVIYFVGGVIAYCNEIKMKELDVAQDVLSSVGAVSCEVAEKMAAAVRTRFGASMGNI